MIILKIIYTRISYTVFFRIHFLSVFFLDSHQHLPLLHWFTFLTSDLHVQLHENCFLMTLINLFYLSY